MDNVNVVLLGATNYSFKDENTGKLIEGTNVWFQEEKEDSTENACGFIPKKARLDYSAFTHMKSIHYPVKAKPVLETRYTSRGVSTKITHFEILGSSNAK